MGAHQFGSIDDGEHPEFLGHLAQPSPDALLTASLGLVVSYAEQDCLEQAHDLAELLGAEIVAFDRIAHLGTQARGRKRAGQQDNNDLQSQSDAAIRLALVVSGQGLRLFGAGMELAPDLDAMARRLRPHLLRAELLVRAAGSSMAVNPQLAVDATAGLGEDSLLLAAAGYHVLLCERNPVIFLLLQDSLRRAAKNPALAKAVGRMNAINANSIQVLTSFAQAQDRPDLVYLDPMFPGRQKSASVKKKLQLLQLLEEPEDNEELLLEAALRAAQRRVVVKRPVKGPWLAGVAPAHSVAGKAVRFDCLVPRH